MPDGYGTRRDADLAKEMVRDRASTDRWIIEGVYGWLAQEALFSATAFIWLDLPEPESVENIRNRGLRRGGNEASFEALLVWAGEYRIRENATHTRDTLSSLKALEGQSSGFNREWK
jgi:hypothetical protein